MQNLTANAMLNQGRPENENRRSHHGPDDEMHAVRLQRFMENVNAKLGDNLDTVSYRSCSSARNIWWEIFAK